MREGALASQKGSSDKTRKDKEKFPSLFEWAESAAAKRGRKLEDVAAVSTKAVPGILALLATCWFAAPPDASSRTLLGTCTFFAGGFTLLVWAIRALQSTIANNGLSIFLHGLGLLGACMALLVGLAGQYDFDRRHAEDRSQNEQKEAREKEQADQTEKKHREDEDRAARLDAECQKRRGLAVSRARRVQRDASTALEDCKQKYAGELFPGRTLDDFCKGQKSLLDGARTAVGAAENTLCSTASIKNGK